MLARVAVLTFVIAGALAPAPAFGNITKLGRAGFGTIVLDDARQHVFVTGPTANAVYELDYSGNLLATTSNVYGAWGMTINGNYLYVAESTAGAIARFDLAGATMTPSTVTTGLNNPRWLVMTGGRLWTTTGSSFGWDNIVSIDPTTDSTSTLSETYYGADLAVSPGDPSTLFVAEDGLSPGSVYRFDVSASPPTEVAHSSSNEQENIGDLVVSPDGTRVIPASGYPYLFQELSASTLEPDGLRYPGSAYPTAVAVSGSGLLATATRGGRESILRTYPLGSPSATFTATCNLEVPPHGLALSADGSSLFAIGFAGEETVLTTPGSGCSPRLSEPPPTTTPPTTPQMPSSSSNGSQPPPNLSPELPHLQFSPRTPRAGRPDVSLEINAFREELVSRLTHAPLGYRYFFAARRIHCLNGATHLIFTAGGARRTTSCRPGPILISGEVAVHRTYAIRVQAIRVHKHRIVKRGASYSGQLYMPGSEASWTRVAQVPPSI